MPSSRTWALLWVGSVGLALAVSACVFGLRGQLNFSEGASLDDLQTVQIQLPATELTVIGDPSRSRADWSGSWSTLGGTAKSALEDAAKAELRWETWGHIGRLSAVLPIDIRDITKLDSLKFETSSSLAHEIEGAGDVFVTGIDAFVSIELIGGNVEVLGGLEQIRVETGIGNIRVSTGAGVDLRTKDGHTRVSSLAFAPVFVDSEGPVTIELEDAEDLDIDVRNAGQIILDLDTAAHIGEGSYLRTLGSGSRAIQIRAGGGDVVLRMADEGGSSEEGSTDTSGEESDTDESDSDSDGASDSDSDGASETDESGSDESDTETDESGSGESDTETG